MSKAYNDKLIVLPRLQYKLSTDKILSIPVNLDGDRKEFVDSNRSRDVNSYQQSVVERNESNVYRLGGKIKQLFYNTI